MIRILFDGPPSFESGRFVEVEGPDGASINVGDWCDRGDGFWSLDIPVSVPSKDEAARIAELEAEIASLRARAEELETELRKPILNAWDIYWRTDIAGEYRLKILETECGFVCNAWLDPDSDEYEVPETFGPFKTSEEAKFAGDNAAWKTWRLL